MPEILSVEKNSSQNPFKKGLRKFSQLDRFWRLALPSLLLLIIVTPIIVQNTFTLKNNAASPEEGSNYSLTGMNPNSPNGPQIFADEILVKVKKQAKEKVKEGNPLDTGLPSLDAIHKEHNVQGFEKAVKRNATGSEDSEIFRWYKVNLGGEKKKITLSHSAELFGGDEAVMRLQVLKAKLANDPNIEIVDYNAVVTTQIIPNDPYFAATSYMTAKFGAMTQWAPQKVAAQAAWEITQGDPTIKIAIVDTGVDSNHPDLQGKVVGSVTYTGRTVQDDFGHGTHVAGIAAANTNNSTGIAGICPKCSILSVKVLGADGSGSTNAVVSGMIYAVDQGARVINLSLGGPLRSQIARDALDYVIAHNALPVVAMGNSSTTRPGDYAHWYNALRVVAVDQAGVKADFSSFGPQSDVAAPGVGVLSTMPTYATTLNTQHGYKTNYDALSGTSMATPVVSGIAGLIFSRNPQLTPVQVKGIIEASAGDGSSFSEQLGFGIVNAAKAVSLATNSDKTAPVEKVISPLPGVTVTRSFMMQFSPSDTTGVHHIDLVRDGTRFGLPLTSTVAKGKTSTSAWTLPIHSTLFWNGPQTLTSITYDTVGNAIPLDVPFTVQNTYVTKQSGVMRLCYPSTKSCPNFIWVPSFALQYPAVVRLQATQANIKLTNVKSGADLTVLFGGAISAGLSSESWFSDKNPLDYYPRLNYCEGRDCGNSFTPYVAGWIGKNVSFNVMIEGEYTATVTYPQ